MNVRFSVSYVFLFKFMDDVRLDIVCCLRLLVSPLLPRNCMRNDQSFVSPLGIAWCEVLQYVWSRFAGCQEITFAKQQCLSLTTPFAWAT